MVINSFFFGSGMALFISLLAWGDRIRRQQDDILQLEKNYIARLKKRLKKNKEDILPVIRDPSRFSFGQQMDSAIGLFKKVSGKELKLRSQIVKLREEHLELTKLFSTRYYLIVVLTGVSFLYGILSTFLSNIIIPIGKFHFLTINRALFASYILFLAYIVFILVKTSDKEKSFIDNLNIALDNME